MITYPTARDQFPINSYVLVEYRNNTLRRGPKSKLLPFLKGPMRVVDSNGSSYSLQDLVTMRIKRYHVSKIREFRFDPNTQDPLTYAIKDNSDEGVYAVDRISKIFGNPKGSKKQLSFEVYWRGYEEPTVEPWSALRRTKALHDFLRNHKDKKVNALVPVNYPPTSLRAESNDEYSDSDNEENW